MSNCAPLPTKDCLGNGSSIQMDSGKMTRLSLIQIWGGKNTVHLFEKCKLNHVFIKNKKNVFNIFWFKWF